MASLDPVGTALSAGQRIGRYFALVSLLPALLLVMYGYLLLASQPFTGKPEFRNVEAALSSWTVGKVTGLILASLAVSLILHPLQFATTQLLEGYWGTSPLAIAAMKMRIIHHRKRRRELWDRIDDYERAWKPASEKMVQGDAGWEDEPGTLEEKALSRMQSPRGDPLMIHFIAQQEAQSQLNAAYPEDLSRILPTQLGNALRRSEDSAGKQYGLSAITIAPHLHLMVPQRHLEYLVDSRQDMDSAIRICTVGLIGTAMTAYCFFDKGLWLLWAIFPYFISYLAYKGAVSAAQTYGIVVGSVIDLNRFILYKELGLRMPRNTVEERQNNVKLMSILNGGEGYLSYMRGQTRSHGIPTGEDGGGTPA
jgi:hypothetical protein